MQLIHFLNVAIGWVWLNKLMKDLENSDAHVLGSVTVPFLVLGEVKTKM